MLFRSKPALLEGLEVDQYQWGIIDHNANNPVDEVTMDSSASWRTAAPPTGQCHPVLKEEENDGSSMKRWNKAMSPGSMTLPTTNNYDLGQSLSPYAPPDMNSEFTKVICFSSIKK